MRWIPVKSTLARTLTVTLLAFGLVPAAWGASKLKVLHNFGAPEDGNDPSGPPLLDGKGNLYGATSGGPGMYGNGTVYEVSPRANGTWKEVILHNFTSGSGGAGPWGSLVRDGSGHLYGTMPLGTANIGGVFSLTPGSHGWVYSVLYTESSGPGLLLDNLGNLYGEMGDGENKGGAIAELSPGSNGWAYTQLYSFCGQYSCLDGVGPPAPPIWDGKGNLYGTTVYGGNTPSYCSAGGNGCGVIFEMTPNRDGTWTYHVLHRFAAFPTDGQRPFAGLVMDTAGNFYGSTALGGVHNQGTVFKFAFSSDHWKKTVLYNFPHCADGCYPGYAMVFDKAGNLYGAANGGLADCDGYDCGVVFKLSPQAGGTWTYSVVHKFTAADGEYPLGLVIDSKGNLFGTTQSFGKYHFGTAFEIIP
jgi:uncharacterized repeat protein (TIGR03803 family)